MERSSRAVAAITSGFLPALVAFIVLWIIDRDVTAALVTAAIIWAGMSVVMWYRFGKRAGGR